MVVFLSFLSVWVLSKITKVVLSLTQHYAGVTVCFCIFSPSCNLFAVCDYGILKEDRRISKNNYISWIVYFIQCRSFYRDPYFFELPHSTIQVLPAKRKKNRTFMGASKKNFHFGNSPAVPLTCYEFLVSTPGDVIFS